MSDDERRRLERLVEAGDPAARARLVALNGRVYAPEVEAFRETVEKALRRANGTKRDYYQIPVVDLAHALSRIARRTRRGISWLWVDGLETGLPPPPHADYPGSVKATHTTTGNPVRVPKQPRHLRRTFALVACSVDEVVIELASHRWNASGKLPGVGGPLQPHSPLAAYEAWFKPRALEKRLRAPRVIGETWAELTLT
jgi:hypothetical protein